MRRVILYTIFISIIFSNTVFAFEKKYIVVHKIYPFSNLNMLCRMSDRFYNTGTPFIIVIAPVYNNFEYPAFKKYTQVLRYVQSKNGSIIVDGEIIPHMKNAFEAEDIMILETTNCEDMILYNFPNSDSEMDKIFEDIKNSWFKVCNYRKNFTDREFVFDELPYIEEYGYVDESESKFDNFFEFGNRIAATIVFISMILILIFIYIGYYLYKKKFYR